MFTRARNHNLTVFQRTEKASSILTTLTFKELALETLWAARRVQRQWRLNFVAQVRNHPATQESSGVTFHRQWTVLICCSSIRKFQTGRQACIRLTVTLAVRCEMNGQSIICNWGCNIDGSFFSSGLLFVVPSKHTQIHIKILSTMLRRI